MAIEFKPGKPSDADILEQAAGVGLIFPEGSPQEMWFLIFCNRMWAHGYGDGVDAVREVRKSLTEAREAI